MPDNKTVTFDASQWQLVPNVPTEEMLKAGSNKKNYGITSDVYVAMLAAAPTPAAQSAGQEAVVIGYVYPEGGRLRFADKSDTVAKHAIPLMRPVCYANAAPVNGGTHGLWDVYAFGKWQRRVSAPVAWDAHTVYLDMVKNGWSTDIELRGVSSANYSAPVNGGERELGQVIDERDLYHDVAEKLADAIAKHFGVEIGEHSNLNCPWQNALDYIAQATKCAADAQQVGGGALAGWRFEYRADDDAWVVTMPSGDSWTTFGKNPAGQLVAALTSPAKVPDSVMQALDRMSTPLHDSRLSGLTAELDADNVKTIRDYVLSGASPAKVGRDERDRHSDDKAVDLFASAMKKKLAEARLKGRRGWQTCSPDDLSHMLREHVEKGDPRDVANFCMFLWMLSAPISRAALSADGGEDKRDADTLVRVLEMCKRHKIVQGDDYQLGAHQLAVKIDAVIRAASQARPETK